MRSCSGRAPATLALPRARRALLAALVPLAAACTDRARAPTGPPSAPMSPRPESPTLPSAPIITGPAELYQRMSPSSYGSDAYLLSSNSDSTFVIIFSNGETHWGWSGRYARTDSVLVFRYNAWSAAGELAAHGTLRGDTLLLRYNAIMQLTDFQDGVYLRVPSRP